MQNHLFIFVPGIAGSKIYCNCGNNGGDGGGTENNTDVINDPHRNRRHHHHHHRKRLYPRKKWFFNSAIDGHMYDCQNIVTQPLKTFWCISIYSKFLKRIAKSPLNKVKVFSYNWRRNPVDLAKDLLAFIVDCDPQQYSHVKLIGHSLGGLLIRIMIEYHGGLGTINLPPDHYTVYQCGTPMFGSQNIQDYNYGFEMAAILASSGLFWSSCPAQKIKKRRICKIKPFLFSITDIRKIIETSSDSLLYLLPTPMINMMYTMLVREQLQTNNYEKFLETYNVHTKLSQLIFPVEYVFFFNISCHRIEKVHLPFCTDDIFKRITIHEVRPGGRKKNECGIFLNRLMKSDGLVVPSSDTNIPHNCNIYVDESQKCSHAYLMNSHALWNIVLRLNNNFEYFNTIETTNDQHLPPGYEEIFN